MSIRLFVARDGGESKALVISEFIGTSNTYAKVWYDGSGSINSTPVHTGVELLDKSDITAILEFIDKRLNNKKVYERIAQLEAELKQLRSQLGEQ